MRIGNYKPEWGGVLEEEIVKVMTSGEILIPQIEVVPTAVVANGDRPPEIEIRFDMDLSFGADLTDLSVPLPVNWQLRFIHNQLFEYFKFDSRFCPGPFHSTIVRKADWRSAEHRDAYFAKCDQVVQRWRNEGPKPLNIKWNVDGSEIPNPPQYASGLWLFLDRKNVTHFFKPNFLPPYDTEEKRSVINNFLMQEWCEDTLQWKPFDVHKPIPMTISESNKVPVKESVLLEEKEEEKMKQ